MFNHYGTGGTATSPHDLRTACPVFYDAFRLCLSLLDGQLHEICGNTDLLFRIRRQTFSGVKGILKGRQIDPDPTWPVFCYPCNAHFDHLLFSGLLLQCTNTNGAMQQYGFRAVRVAHAKR